MKGTPLAQAPPEQEELFIAVRLPGRRRLYFLQKFTQGRAVVSYSELHRHRSRPQRLTVIYFGAADLGYLSIYGAFPRHRNNFQVAWHTYGDIDTLTYVDRIFVQGQTTWVTIPGCPCRSSIASTKFRVFPEMRTPDLESTWSDLVIISTPFNQCTCLGQTSVLTARFI